MRVGTGAVGSRGIGEFSERGGAMKKSIGDNMIPKGWSFERGLELVKKSGWDGIELWLGDVPWFQM
jgi:hypothetical protein